MINTKPSTFELIKEYQESKNQNILESLINEHQNLAFSLVNRYKTSKKEEKEDLNQVALIGLIKAIENFDFSFNVNFSTYAVPIILGEIKKYFRDSSLLKVSRNIKDLYYKIEEEKKKYFALHNKDISLEKLEKVLNIDRYDLLIAMESSTIPLSLEKEYHNKESSYTIQDTISDNKKSNLIDLITLNDSLKSLTKKEKLLIKLRYYNDLSQKDIASKFNVSQVQISRMEKQVLDKLRKQF